MEENKKQPQSTSEQQTESSDPKAPRRGRNWITDMYDKVNLSVDTLNYIALGLLIFIFAVINKKLPLWRKYCLNSVFGSLWQGDTGKSKPVSHQGSHFFHVGAYGFPTKRRKQMAQESMGRASLRQGRGFIASANATSAASSCLLAALLFCSFLSFP